MTDLLIIALFASCLPACFTITSAHRAGARGWLGYAVWLLEELADRLRRAAKWLRDFDAWRRARKSTPVGVRG